jgi:hypothetical protein
MEQTDGREARQEADDARHDDETPVMLCRETVEYAEHGWSFAEDFAGDK